MTFGKICYEHFNVNDKETLRVLTSVNEQDQSQILQSLTGKLYNIIVNKIDDIDFGNIPKSKGDITKIQNYDDLIDSCQVMKDIVIHYGQNHAPIQTIIDAIENIKSRKQLFEKAFMLDLEFPCVTYNVMTLACISSISYMIQICIEFIKSSDNATFEIALDKVAYMKTKDNLLLNNLDKFNKSCIKGELDKTLNYLIDQKTNKFMGAGTFALGVVAFTVLIASVLPFVRELIYFFYLTRQNISDYFAIQADLLQINTQNIQFSDMDANTKEKVIRKQTKIVEIFRRLSDKFAIKMKKGEHDTIREVNNDKRKYNIDEVIDSMPDSASPDSGIF